MPTILRLSIPLLFLIGCQACSTPGGGTSGGSDSPAASAGQSARPADTQALPKGDLVPAVVGIPSDPGPAKTYRIGPQDLLKIEVFQVEEMSSEERVNDGGFVAMALIGDVQVGGLTPGEAEDVIEGVLGKNYLQDPQVNIFVSEYASQDVTVTGNVKKPGVYPLTGRTTLVQAIALAGGFDGVANEEEVIVFRQQSGGTVSAYVVNVEAIQKGELTDPVIVGDDRVVVPKSGTAVFLRGLGDVLRGWVLRAPIY